MTEKNQYPFQLSQLPYLKTALEPFISQQTVSIHYEKHHQAYVNNLNNLLQEKEHEYLQSLTLEDVIMDTAKNLGKVAVFNNAAQIWNHSFYWQCMSPDGGGEPKGELLVQIKRDFDNYDNFRSTFSKAALSQFGSGWAWLVWSKDEKRLLITKTGNADLPMIHNQIALISIDVWEHAYYLDYQNRRGEYVNAFLDKLINWHNAERLFIDFCQ